MTSPGVNQHKPEVMCTGGVIPTTSSIIAALVRTTPILVVLKPLDCMTVKVVPKLVEHNAAPAAKACNDVAFASNSRIYDNPIGRAIPVTATPEERARLAFKDLNEVVSPPGLGQYTLKQSKGSVKMTFVDQQKQAKIA